MFCYIAETHYFYIMNDSNGGQTSVRSEFFVYCAFGHDMAKFSTH